MVSFGVDDGSCRCCCRSRSRFLFLFVAGGLYDSLSLILFNRALFMVITYHNLLLVVIGTGIGDGNSVVGIGIVIGVSVGIFVGVVFLKD